VYSVRSLQRMTCMCPPPHTVYSVRSSQQGGQHAVLTTQAKCAAVALGRAVTEARVWLCGFVGPGKVGRRAGGTWRTWRPRHTFAKVLSLVAFYIKCTWALTVENLAGVPRSQSPMSGAAAPHPPAAAGTSTYFFDYEPLYDECVGVRPCLVCCCSR